MWRPESVSAILSGRLDALPATYRGVRMRSQLEADFAHHLDSMGARNWEYEPKRYASPDGTYLPDFFVGPRMFFEVKPTYEEVQGAMERMEIIWATLPDAVLTVVCAEGCRFYTRERGGPWVPFVERWRHD
jgi:hypothetical protein